MEKLDCGILIILHPVVKVSCRHVKVDNGIQPVIVMLIATLQKQLVNSLVMKEHFVSGTHRHTYNGYEV